MRRALKRALAAADLPGHFSAHSLRHTYATTLIELGAPAEWVQRQLGHRSIAITLDLYAAARRHPALPLLAALDEDRLPPLRAVPSRHRVASGD